MKILVTGASGNGWQAVCRALVQAGYTVRMADVMPPLDRRFELFQTIVHTDHGMPSEVVSDFRNKGPAWCESQVEGAQVLIEKYNLVLPNQVAA